MERRKKPDVFSQAMGPWTLSITTNHRRTFCQSTGLNEDSSLDESSNRRSKENCRSESIGPTLLYQV